MCFLCFIPAAKIIDRNKIYIQVKDICIFFQDIFIGWTIVVISGDSLCFIGIEIIQIFCRYISGSFLIYHLINDRYRRLCQDADARCYDLVIIRIILYRKISFVFPGDQDITLSVFYEGGCCSSCPGIQYKYVCVEFFDEVFDLILIPVKLFVRISPGCKVIPSRSSGSFWIWCDNSDIFFDQIIPVLDPFRISFSDQEYDRGCVRRTVIWKFIDPSFVDQAGIFDCIDIVFQCQCHNVCLQTICNFQCLFA